MEGDGLSMSVSFNLRGKYSQYRAIVDEIDGDLAAIGCVGHYDKSYNPPRIVPVFYYKKSLAYLGRVILERKLGRPLTKGEMAEHRNRNTLDNCRLNLRVANSSQNQANRPAQRNTISGYKGVGWRKDCAKWQVRIGKNRKHLGLFTDKDEAARTYDRAARELFGEFALLNFPD